MQNRNGSMTMLTQEEHESLTFWERPKSLQVNQIFKIKRCYFQITGITPEGIEAKGISRKKYHDLKRGRPDWC